MNREEELDVITIDGPAGSGKSTVARELADRLGWIYIDTGAMYRAVCLKALRSGRDPTDETALVDMIADTEIRIRPGEEEVRVLLDGEDVSGPIRDPRVDQNVSEVAALGGVREKLVEQQRRMGRNGQIVMEGRDIGTVVFPDAKHKFYLEASLEERARRRYNQLDQSGQESPTIQSVKRDMKHRDETDRERSESPLKPPADAIHVDTTNLSVEEVVEQILQSIDPSNSIS